MLPNFRFLVGGVLFCVLLFVVAGVVMLPDSRTRVGEMPEVGRPMMQRSMADAPAQAQFYMMAAARRSDELERLRGPAPAVGERPASAPADADMPAPDLPRLDVPKPEPVPPDLPKPEFSASGLAVSDSPKPDAPAGAAAPKPAAEAPPEEEAASVQPPRDPAPAIRAVRAGQPDPSGSPSQVAAVTLQTEDTPRPTDETDEESAAVPPFTNVPVPAARPAVFSGPPRHARVLHRRRRIVRQYGSAIQAMPAVPAAPAGQTQGYQAPFDQGSGGQAGTSGYPAVPAGTSR